MSTFKGDVPQVAGAKGGALDILANSAITGGNGSFGTAVKAGTTGAYLAGSAIAARALRVIHETTVVGSSVTEVQIALYEATDANGTGTTALANTTLTASLGTPAAGTRVEFEIPLDAVDATKFYALGVAWKASAGTNNTGNGGTTSHLLDPVYVS